MKKKLLSSLLLIPILAMTLSGCDSSGGTTGTTTTGGAASGEEIVPGKVVNISISMFDRGAIPADQGTYADWAGTKLINEQMAKYGVNISWVPVPRNEANAKLNAMITAGMAPDLIWEYSVPWMNTLYQQKAIIPVQDAVDKYSTSYKKYYEENKDMIDPYITKSDGNKYAITSIRTLPELLVGGISVRKDWLDKLGLEVPKTIDELIEVARKMKTLGSDIIPMAGSLHYASTIKATYAIYGQEMKAADGKLIPYFQSENYKEALKTLKLLYDEQLCDPEYVVDTNFARQKQLVSSGKSGIYVNTWTANTAEAIAAIEHDAEAEFISLAPLETEFGTYMIAPQPAARIFTMFNAKIKEEQKQAGIKYVDWLIDGGWEVVTAGVEGVTHNKVDGLRVAIPGAIVWPGSEFAIVSQDKYVKGQYAKHASAQPDERKRKLAESMEASLIAGFSAPSPANIPFDSNEKVYTDFKSVFNTRLSEIETRIITDKKLSVEDGIALIQKEFDTLGGAAAWEAKNKWYEENKDTFEKFQSGFNEWAAKMISNLK